MKIAVIGAGAMGTLFGGKLAMAGNEVTMVDVVPVVLDTINKAVESLFPILHSKRNTS